MRSYTSVTFFRQGTLVGLPWLFNRVDEHPGWTDSWEQIVAFIKAAYDAYSGNDAQAATEAIGFFNSILQGKNVSVVNSSQFTAVQGGHVAGIVPMPPSFPATDPIDEAQVWFRAWSEDDLTKSSAKLDRSAPGMDVAELGERRWEQDDNKFYECGYSIPISQTPPGSIIFGFGSGDDGWFFDVGVASTLTIAIQGSPSPAPVTGIRPIAFDLRNRAAIMAALPSNLRTSPLSEKTLAPKTRAPRPASPTLVGFKQAVAIPFHSSLVRR